MKIKQIAIWFGVILFQLVMMQVVTLLFSFIVPDMEVLQKSQPVLFLLFVGVSFSVGIFLAGWVAIKFGWVKIAPKLTTRLIGTLMGVYLPLILALFIYSTIEAGNPFLTVSMLTGIVGFHLAGWIGK
jgi:uncharacterized YccA/Bax inhibitor family protein